MLRDKIDKLGYDYFGRQYLYFNIVGDILVYLGEALIPTRDTPPDSSYQTNEEDHRGDTKWPYHHSSENTHSDQLH